jgi:hypothetical protein
MVLGPRIRLYHQHADVDVAEYVRKRNESGECFDPELRLYKRCGFVIEKMLPGYMSGRWSDPKSLEYGMLMVWGNPGFSSVG